MNDSNTRRENPRELEERANETRSEINRTLSQIENHFSPSQMIDQAMGLFRNNGGEMANNLGRTVRDNPVPMILTGVGLAWMALSQNSQRSRGYDDYRRYPSADFGRYRGDDYYDRGARGPEERGADQQFDSTPYAAANHAGPGVGRNYTGSYSGHAGEGLDDGSGVAGRSDQDEQSLLDKARETGHDALDTLEDARDEAAYRYRQEADRARQAAQDWRERADGQMQDLRGSVRSTADDASRFMREQPLVVGAAGIALGAFIGALLPPTRMEDRLAGQRSDAITDDVEKLADEKLQEGASTAREKLQKTAEEVRETASDTLSKVDSKVDAAAVETAAVDSATEKSASTV